MTAPLRIPCSSPDRIPSGGELQQLVTRQRHVVLELVALEGGQQYDKQAMIREIAAGLPENYHVFDAGGRTGEGEWITVMQVISREEVIRHEAALLEAARSFGGTARRLVEQLAEHLSVEVSCFWTELLREEVPEEGELPDEWRYYFHGFECCFHHLPSGQVVEVRLGFPDELGVLDPWFFQQFVSSTPGLETVARLFQNEFHDPARALNILEERGLLRRVESSFWSGSGVVVRD